MYVSNVNKWARVILHGFRGTPHDHDFRRLLTIVGVLCQFSQFPAQFLLLSAIFLQFSAFITIFAVFDHFLLFFDNRWRFLTFVGVFLTIFGTFYILGCFFTLGVFLDNQCNDQLLPQNDSISSKKPPIFWRKYFQNHYIGLRSPGLLRFARSTPDHHFFPAAISRSSSWHHRSHSVNSGWPWRPLEQSIRGFDFVLGNAEFWISFLVRSWVDVMITIFGDFRRFSAIFGDFRRFSAIFGDFRQFSER
jgi:hypothetical protein